MFRVAWEDQERLVATVDQLDTLLDDIHRDHQEDKAVLASIELDSTGDSLAIGLGKDRSVLNFVSGSKDPPYFTSVGHEGEDNDEPIVFRYMGQWSEFLLRNTVPIDTAREAVRTFCRTGEIPNDVRWEQD